MVDTVIFPWKLWPVRWRKQFPLLINNQRTHDRQETPFTLGSPCSLTLQAAHGEMGSTRAASRRAAPRLLCVPTYSPMGSTPRWTQGVKQRAMELMLGKRWSQRSMGGLGLLFVSLWMAACAPCRQREVAPCPLPTVVSAPCAGPPQDQAPQDVAALRLKRHVDPHVQSAQQRLQQQGYDPGPVDGMMGNRTRAALRQFQRHEGLTVTGQLDKQTTARLVHFSGVPGAAAGGEKERGLPSVLSGVSVY